MILLAAQQNNRTTRSFFIGQPYLMRKGACHVLAANRLAFWACFLAAFSLWVEGKL